MRRSEVAPTTVAAGMLTVAFDTNVRGLAWQFTPNVPSQQVRPGATNLAFFKVTNTSDQPLTGRAIYNVTPESAGAYFSKLECFCFKNQTLAPHQSAEFPVVYYVDPRFGQNDDTKGIEQITLSYTSTQPSPWRRSRGKAIAPRKTREAANRDMAHDGVKHDYHLVNPSPWAAVRLLRRLRADRRRRVVDEGHLRRAQAHLVDGRARLRLVLLTMLLWWSDVVKEGNEGDHTPVVSIGLRYGMILFNRLRGDVLRRLVLDLLRDGPVPPRAHLLADRRRRQRLEDLPPKGVELVPAVRAAAGQHSDVADLWHHRHLGSPRAADRRPQRRQVGPGADHPAGDAVHLDPGVSSTTTSWSTICSTTRIHQLRPLWLGLLHGHGLPRLPRIDRHHLPDRLSDPAARRRLHAHQALRFEAAAWYWHFVDVVWLFLFTFLYFTFAPAGEVSPT
ncbi:MAG: cytochrome c oxidase assembly protein [Caulobacteraceae bacterium]